MINNLHRNFVKTSLLALSSLALAACGGPTDADTGAEENVGETTSEDTSLVVYSNSLSDGRDEWLGEKANEEGFDLEFVSAGGDEIYNRVLAEKAAPQADIVFGLDESFFVRMSQDDLLAQYTPSWAPDLPENAIASVNEDFYPIINQHVFFMYNAEHLDEAPETIQELASDYQGLYRAPRSLGGNTNQKALLSLLLQYRDDEGELGISQEGWDVVETFIANSYELAEGEDNLGLFADGTKPIDYWYSSGIAEAEETYGFTATPIVPETGVMTFSEQVAIVNQGEDANYDTAQEFVDWFGSAEIQGQWAEEFGTVPALEEAHSSINERTQELVSELEPMEVDWEFVNEYLSEWIEKIELELIPF